MRQKTKLLLVLLMTAVLLGSSVFPNYAQNDAYKRIDEKPVLLESKTVNAEGIPVRFDLYDDKGVKV